MHSDTVTKDSDFDAKNGLKFESYFNFNLMMFLTLTIENENAKKLKLKLTSKK